MQPNLIGETILKALPGHTVTLMNPKKESFGNFLNPHVAGVAGVGHQN